MVITDKQMQKKKQNFILFCQHRKDLGISDMSAVVSSVVTRHLTFVLLNKKWLACD